METQFGAVSDAAHRYKRDADKPVPTSLASGETDSVVFIAPDRASATGAGVTGALTVTDNDDDPHDAGGVAGAHEPEIELHTAYINGVAVPEKVFNGTKVTTFVDVFSVQVPSPDTTRDVRVHPELVDVIDSLAAHNFKLDAAKATVPCVV